MAGIFEELRDLTLRLIASCKTLDQLEQVRLFALGKHGWIKQGLKALYG